MAHSYGQGDEPVPGSGYRLTSFLGRGGFGEVWKATAPGGAEAALKIIRLGGQEGRKEFRALQLVKRVRHPNLVPIIAFWLKDKDGTILDDAYAGQENLPTGEMAPAGLRATMVAPPDLGRLQAAELIVAMGLGDLSLFDRLEQCRAQGLEGIPADELLGYMEDVAEAIDFLNRPVHELGSGPAAIQHCDIKPHNLMIVGGAVQICDFGLARMMGADRATTAAATIAYAAPECLQTGQPSPSTDQYSLAVTYYELRTGALPYESETLAAVMAAKEQEKLDYSRLPPGEQAVLRRATLRDPAKRYPSAAAMVKAMHDAAAASTASTQGTTTFRPAIRRGPPLVASLALAALLTGLTFGGWLLWNNRGKTPPAGGEQAGTASGPPAIPPTSPALPLGTQRADALAERGDWSGAIDAYAETIDGDGPANVKAQAYFGRGRCQLSMSRPGQAIGDFEAAIRLDPDNAQDFKRRKEYVQAYLDRGTRHLSDQQYDRAIPDLQRVIELAPDNARAASALGQTYLQLGTAALEKRDFDTAISYFDRAGKYNPHDALIFVRRAGAWFGKDQFAKAVEDLTTSIRIKDNDADHVTRGLAYRQLGEIDKALADFAEAIRLNAHNAAALAYRGVAYMAKFDDSGAAGDLDRATDDLSRSVEICRQTPDAAFRLADALLFRAACYRMARKPGLAANDFAEVLRLDPKHVQRLHVQLDELAADFAQEGQPAEAAKWEAKAIESAPDEPTKAEYRSRLEKYRAGKP